MKNLKIRKNQINFHAKPFIAIQEAAKHYRIEIIDMEVDADHIHIICSIPMDMAPTRALHLLKGYSAKILFVLIPGFRKRYPKGHLWSPGKFAASVGHITVEKAKAYLEAHHAKAIISGIPARSEAEGLLRRVGVTMREGQTEGGERG